MFSFPKLIAFNLFVLATATRFPPAPTGLTTIPSSPNNGVSLSFKETNICETTPGVKSWAGYIHLPVNDTEQRPFDVNTFFWFFESRKDPANAPMSIWIQGGPGVPSVTAALGENGPCIVNEDSTTTTLNKWSWNNEVNMLYIDQPVGAGFSYDALVNGTIDQLSSRTTGAVNVTVRDFSTFPLPDINNQTYFAGTFASQKISKTFNTTANSAIAAWHFLQTFTQEFPAYKPPNNKLSIWTESYGGHWGPTFTEYFLSQNDLISNGSIQGTPLEIENLGIINGCVDLPTQMGHYPQMAFNNTYGLKVINESAFQAESAAYPACLELTQQCRTAVAEGDPDNKGINPLVDAACAKAYQACFATVSGAYGASGRDLFDIGQSAISSFPPKWAAAWLNSADIQAALGVPLNITGQSLTTTESFALTGDFVREGNLENLGKLVDRGVNVALVYGDRDYQCNCMPSPTISVVFSSTNYSGLGGENVSLSITSSQTSSFKSSGYTPFVSNSSSSVEAYTRQSGSLSFTRVLDSGHQVPYYKPEVAYTLFNRHMQGKDLATGKIDISANSSYTTSGPTNIFSIKNIAPGSPGAPPQVQIAGTSPAAPSICYTYDAMQTCNEQQWGILQQGNGIFKDFILIGYMATNGSQVFFNGSIPASGSSNPGSDATQTGTGAGSSSTSSLHIGSGVRNSGDIALSMLGVVMLVSVLA